MHVRPKRVQQLSCQNRVSLLCLHVADCRRVCLQTVKCLSNLGEVPLHITIRETSDAGTPVMATEPDGAEAQAYAAIAEALDAKVATMSASGARQAPKIVVE